MSSGPLSRLLVALLCALLLLAGGCKSSRKSSRPPYSKTEKPRPGKSSDEKVRVVEKSDNDLVAEAKRWLGTPYRYGGTEKGKGTDCSGLTMTVYHSVLGLKIPRNSAEQQKFCAPLKRNELQAGDLVFFSSAKGRGRVSHVGLYVDEGIFIHASSSRGVIASSLDENYYATHYHSSGRVPGKKSRDAGRDAPRRVRPENTNSTPATPEPPAPVPATSEHPATVPAPLAPAPTAPPAAAPAPAAPAPAVPVAPSSALPEGSSVESPLIPNPPIAPAPAPAPPVALPDSVPSSVVADSIAARVRMAF